MVRAFVAGGGEPPQSSAATVAPNVATGSGSLHLISDEDGEHLFGGPLPTAVHANTASCSTAAVSEPVAGATYRAVSEACPRAVPARKTTQLTLFGERVSDPSTLTARQLPQRASRRARRVYHGPRGLRAAKSKRNFPIRTPTHDRSERFSPQIPFRTWRYAAITPLCPATLSARHPAPPPPASSPPPPLPPLAHLPIWCHFCFRVFSLRLLWNANCSSVCLIQSDPFLPKRRWPSRR